MNGKNIKTRGFFMELIKNKVSGKFFIVLDESGDQHAMVITPEGKVKRLERRLFGFPITVDVKKSEWRSHLTREQMTIYSGYRNKEVV